MKFKRYIRHYRENLALALPVVVTQAGQVTVQLADNIMVGRLGTAQLASVSFANSIFILGMVFGIGFTQGLTPHVGQGFGRGEEKRVSSLLENSLLLNFFVGLLLTGAMAMASYLMGSMGQTENVIFYSRQYYNILLYSLLPFILFFGLRQFSEGIGITKYAMYITLVTNLLNVFLNWIFIFGKFGMPAMGVKGAALATLISRILMMFSFLLIFFKLPLYNRYLKEFSFNCLRWDIVKDILKTSLPLSIQNLVEITAFSLSAIMVGWLGEVSLASHQVAMSMSSFSFMLALGLGAAATIRVSHNYGSGDYKAMREAGFATIHLSVGFMAITGVAYLLLRNYIPLIYTNDMEVVKLASTLLIISALFQMFDALQLSSLAALRALADVRVPLMQSIFSYYFICLPLGYLFGFVFKLGAVGVWIGLLLGLAFVGILFLFRFHRVSNRLIKEQQLS